MANRAHYLLSLDAGTTGVTAMAFDLDLRPVERAYAEFPQGFPRPGWVEHSAPDILGAVDATVAAVIGAMGRAPSAIGITNQRETVFAMDIESGAALEPGIVWQDRRTAERCRELQSGGHGDLVRRASGLRLDPYFSATKIEWLLRNSAAVEAAAGRGTLRFATVDALIIHHLTGGASLATEPTNASRTMLVDLGEPMKYDQSLCELFGVKAEMMPEIRASAGEFGQAQLRDPSAAGEKVRVPITGVLGDQQAALFGQGGWDSGAMKNTYGTGCFLLLNTGSQRIDSEAGLLTTIAADVRGRPAFALEGSSFAGGTVIQWMRDQLGLFENAADSEALAKSVPDTGGVTLVPAFAGLGSPHWDPDARAALLGMTRGTSRAHIARAGLDAIALQCTDLIEAMRRDSGANVPELLVDGGAAANDYLMQRQADLAGLTIRRPQSVESTARGAAAMAAVGAGLIESPGEAGCFSDPETFFEPSGGADERRPTELAQWSDAVRRVLSAT